MHEVDVAVISETHLHSKIPDNRVSLKGYHVLRRDRDLIATDKSKGGGVIVYVNEEVQHMVPKVEVPDVLEVVWCILWPSDPHSTYYCRRSIPAA